MMYIRIAAIFLMASFLSFKPVDETFIIDKKSSSISWEAGKVGGSHQGTVRLASGSLSFKGKNITGGKFGIDMTSIEVTDLKGDSNGRLLNHLKSDDFFSVETHPVSTFEITGVSAAGADRVNISGRLTIKGITNNLSFPATVKRQKNTVVAVAKGVKVDRTKYDIKYRSKTIFGDIGDKAIDDEFVISINLLAKR